jgi:hypothetical protein
VGATVVSGVNAPPVFEAPEHVFDLMALFVEGGVMRDRGFAVGFGRNAGPQLGETRERGGALAVSRPCKGKFRPAQSVNVMAASKELAAQAAGTCVDSPSGPKNPKAESR